jgi:hypothetical protein
VLCLSKLLATYRAEEYTGDKTHSEVVAARAFDWEDNKGNEHEDAASNAGNGHVGSIIRHPIEIF